MRNDLATWLGWALVGVIALAVIISWLPAVGLPLGDSHEGRILARFGLHMRNFWNVGPIGSGFATSIEPFAPSYSSHPPLMYAAHLAVSAFFGQGVTQLRAPSYAAGVATIFLGAALLRTLGLRWLPIALALAAMSATPLFWVYGRLGGGFSLILALAAIVVKLRDMREPPRWLVVTGVLVALATVLLSWQGVLSAAFLGLWLLRGRGLDRTTAAIGMSMIVALLLTGVWIAQGIGTSNLVSLALQRSSGLTFTLGEWLSRQWLWLDVLFPTWYLLVLVMGVVVGLLDQRTRFVTALFAGITIAWALAFPTGSFIHDFWSLSSLAVGLVGIAALTDRIWQLLSPRGARLAAGIGLALAAIAFWGVSSGPMFFDYFEAPSEAGGLVHDNEPPPTQQVAWTTTPVAVAYWLSWYWDLPARQLGEEQLSAIDADDLVLIRTDLLPDWIEPEAASRALAKRGQFALVNAEALRPSPVTFSPVSPAGVDESHDP